MTNFSTSSTNIPASEAPNLEKEETYMERDPICNMTVYPDKAAGKSEYEGQTYYFCSVGCKKRFDANPAQYAAK